MLKLKIKKYLLENVFNMDETALFYKQHPSKSIKLSGTKSLTPDKHRITISFCCNGSDSKKRKNLFIHFVKTPRCFKNFESNYFID